MKNRKQTLEYNVFNDNRNKFIPKLPVEMKWDVKQPRTYFKNNLNNERQLSSSQRTMQINSHTKNKKREKHMNNRKQTLEYNIFNSLI